MASISVHETDLLQSKSILISLDLKVVQGNEGENTLGSSGKRCCSTGPDHNTCHLVPSNADIFTTHPGFHVSKTSTPQTFPRYGDISNAWAPLNSSGHQEFLHLKFQTPVHICGVDVFETWNPGCVVKISAFDGTKWQVLWSGPVEQHRLPELPRVFSPSFPCTTFKSDHIRIDLDCRRSVSWTEIDAIRLRGRESYLWTPNTHCRYAPPLKQTVFQFLLCMNRLQEEEKISVTQDVVSLICQYLAQSYIDC